MKRGITLVDLLVTISLAGLLFAGGFRVISAERHALRVARDNTIALFALEGLRNRILSDIMNNYAFEIDRVRKFADDMKLPYPVELKIFDGSPETAGQRRLVIRMNVPGRMYDPARAYVREVVLP